MNFDRKFESRLSQIKFDRERIDHASVDKSYRCMRHLSTSQEFEKKIFRDTRYFYRIGYITHFTRYFHFRCAKITTIKLIPGYKRVIDEWKLKLKVRLEVKTFLG